MKYLRCFAALLGCGALTFAGFAQSTDPRITSWVTNSSARYARVYETSADKTSGNAVSTWPRSGLTNGGGGQSTAAYSEVQRVAYSSTYVYITTSGLPSYTMGHWLTPNGGVYTSWPTNRGAIHRIPRTPSIPTTKQKTNGSGGVLVNGVFVWANGDAQSYNTSTGVVSMQGGQGIWNRLAGVAEAFNFDAAYGHQPNNGAYHNHVNPIALRYQLGDNVAYNAATKNYSEAASLTKHSPLIGWANDGLPIYGPYGYSSAMDSASGVRRMTTGFQKRDGTNGTTNLAQTGRTTLPKWAAEVQGKSQTLAATDYGPATTATYQVAPGVTGTYALGMFAEDYDYLGDLGKTQGTDFDLNRQNVRFCVTPEFPNGTYAYFVAIDANGATVFPDIINQEFFGTAAMGQGTVTSINETVTEHAVAGPAANIVVTATAAEGGVALAWNSAEGATYKVESSADNTSWATLAAAVTSAGTTTNYTAASAVYYRVTLTAIATYDTKGTSGTPVGKTGSVSFGAPTATAPTISQQPVSLTVAAGTAATFSVVASGTAPLTYQWKKDGSSITAGTAANYSITSAATTDQGRYTCVVTNSAGTVTSAAAMLTVTSVGSGGGGATGGGGGTTSGAPTIVAQPTSVGAVVGGTATFAVSASGTAPLTYQWRLNGTNVSGATGATLTLTAVRTTDAGLYSVVVSNSAGTATSSAATLTVSSVATAPTIMSEPVDVTVTAGETATFAVVASGTAPLSYQWSKDGSALAGATGATLVLPNVTAAGAARYAVTVRNAQGSVLSRTAQLTVKAAASFAGQYFGTLGSGQFALHVRADRTAAFLGYVAASGTWIVERDVAVTEEGRLRFTSVAETATLAGRSAATVQRVIDLVLGTNDVVTGSVTGGETLMANGTKAASTGVAANFAGLYQSGASGSASTAHTIVGADGRAFVLAIAPGAVTAATAAVDATGKLSGMTTAGTSVSGTVTSGGGTLTTTIASTTGAVTTFTGGADGRAAEERLINLSTRGRVTAEPLIVGFVVSGDAAKRMLVRAVGPSLTEFGVEGALAAARLQVFRGQGVVATGEQWTSGGFANTAALVAAAARVGAFPFESTSRDAALLLELEPGAYTAVVSGVGGVTGIALVEVYDAAEAVNYSRRLTNVATRATAGAGDAALIAGFVISGSVAKRVLIRGIGPTLSGFGVEGVLADPQLRIQNGTTTIVSNDNWSSDPAVASFVSAAAADVGAFALPMGSRDAAVLVHLAPGAYTAQVSGATAGNALIEVYELP